ncbi:U-box domain-containing protein 35-like [Punica granatum]|uniref:RING-type E3 ubiquitin transferase n=1 Tax=Punica granatum TaxID=22663 RepID=A0A6P8CAV1_PUNGR|nr:U-box domain-containing protein 35-like [Punica granatum]
MAKRGDKREESVAVAIDKDKASQYALKWAVDHLLGKGQVLTLLHIKTKASSITVSGIMISLHLGSNGANGDTSDVYKAQLESQARELFLPFRCFCTRKEIQCNEVIIEDSDITKGIIDYINTNAIDTIVLGAPTKSGLFRFKSTDVPGSVCKGAPEFCTVYIISKGKISAVRSASSTPPKKPLPLNPPLPIYQNSTSATAGSVAPVPAYQNEVRPGQNHIPRGSVERNPLAPRNMPDENEIKSPFTRPGAAMNRSYERTNLDSDISFVSGGRPSTDRSFQSLFDGMEPARLSGCSDYDNRSFGGISSFSSQGKQSFDISSQQLDFGSSSSLEDSGRLSISSQTMEDVEAEMRRLRLELKQTIDMYSTACKEALTAKEKANQLHQWKMREEQRLEEARMAEEAALELAEREKAKCKAALEAAEVAQRIAEREAQKRINAEKKAVKEAEERKKIMSSLGQDRRYRKYTIEEIETATDNFAAARKIGEGGYGPVYKCYLDHTAVAIKVLRPDAAQGRSQFQQEVEVLSCIRHPNMVLLLGACPEYGCLVYEYMANGSLEDRLFRRGNSPVLPWQIRFRIAAEIGTGLLFLHQTKPEPLVHRDLKPGNILLDRNFVSKISDVGLARLVPPSVANSVTQYRMTSTAGTFCYIDPEYQQTGMLGIKSDIYSLGIMLLQIITAKPPMGLTHLVEEAIERGTFAKALDPSVTDWPVEETMSYAKVALKCAELRRRDRPDLGTVVLPELNRLRALAESSMPSFPQHSGGTSSPSTSSSGPASSSSMQVMTIYEIYFLKLKSSRA